jgi:DNA modification methylase
MPVDIRHGDALSVLRTMPDESVQCCITSPPYFGLRDYGVEGQAGLEATPEAYIANMVEVFREVRRVLRDDGTLWLNIGDSYAGPKPAGGADKSGFNERYFGRASVTNKQAETAATKSAFRTPAGYKPKDLLMIPAMLALALRADGWFLRKDIIWHKPNPMPESVTDRPTSAHEHVFLLAKSARYLYDAGAISEEFASKPYEGKSNGAITNGDRNDKGRTIGMTTTRRNARDVWTITPKPYKGAHFATMPPTLAERCMKAGTRPGDTVLDPFGGAGTTGLVASRLGRDAVLIELNPAYCTLARARIDREPGLQNAMARLNAAIDRFEEALRGQAP